MLYRRVPILSSTRLANGASYGLQSHFVTSFKGRLATHKNGGTIYNVHNGRAHQTDEERDIFLSVLSASTTKRDAKSYLSRFSPSSSNKRQAEGSHTEHVALIKLGGPECLTDIDLEGLVRTLSQLSRLGLSCIVVIEAQQRSTQELHASRLATFAQADRLVSALEQAKSVQARRLDDLLGFSPLNDGSSATVRVRGSVEVQYPELLSRSLKRGQIPILSPVAFTEDTQRLVDVDSNEAVLAIIRELAGVRSNHSNKVESEGPSAFQTEKPQRPDTRYVLDRIVILDPVGAIPSSKRLDHTHIFLNLDQEYEETRRELLDDAAKHQSKDHDEHIRNLDLLHSALALLPPSSSALLTTPWQAATPARRESDNDALGVQTRRPKNPLIFNLLTDKPLVSSSLPTARMNQQGGSTAKETQPVSMHATFAKRGMPLTMIPDPNTDPWKPPRSSEYHMSLEDARIDFPRLLNLIEDSFNRPLDVSHYLNRIRNKIAGIIVAGEYEGGAILTWELPPGVHDDGSESSRQRMVPYLDKFAVLKRSQGAGGVADIVFSAMVRTCFPNGVCWRSRRDNPVNKWYFERSVGTWKIPDSNWTMFWTDKDLQQDSQQWRDYEVVCRTVAPSWSDNKHKAD